MRSSWRFRRELSNVVALVASNVTNLVREVQPVAASVDQRCPGGCRAVRVKKLALSVPGNLCEKEPFCWIREVPLIGCRLRFQPLRVESTMIRFKRLAVCGWCQPHRGWMNSFGSQIERKDSVIENPLA